MQREAMLHHKIVESEQIVDLRLLRVTHQSAHYPDSP